MTIPGVGTFIQPDFETQTGTEYKTAIDNSIKVMSQVAALFAPHESAVADMYVQLDAGSLFTNNEVVIIPAQQTSIFTRPVTHPRIDRIVIDVNGTAEIIPGVEAASPAPPDIGGTKLPICQVLLNITMTTITNEDIADERVLGAFGSGSGSGSAGVFFENISGVNPSDPGELGNGTWELYSGLVQVQPYYHPGAFSPHIDPGYDTYVRPVSNTGTEQVLFYVLPGPPATPAPAYGPFDYGVKTFRCRCNMGAEVFVWEILYENYITGNHGFKDFTLWGLKASNASNYEGYYTNPALADNDTNWVQLTTEEDHFELTATPTRIKVLNVTEKYQYYQIKVTRNWEDSNTFGINRLELNSGCYRWFKTAE